MTTPTPWSDVPPSEPGWYWLRKLRTGQCVVRCRNEDASWPVGHLGSDDEVMRDYYHFGPRVLTAEETVELTVEVERLKSEVEFLKSRIAGMNEVFGAVRMAVGQNVMGSDPVEEPDYDAPWLPCGLLVRIDNVMEREYRE